MRPASGVLTIDLGAVVENWRRLAREAPAAEVAAVVKANAYGLGADRVGAALAAAGCRSFFVAQCGEALALRRRVSHAAIFVLNGLLPGEAAAAHAAGLIPVLNNPAQIDTWSRIGRTQGTLPAALHLDTGMTRLGLLEHEAEALAADLGRLAGIEVRLLMSHLSVAEEADNPLNRIQLDRFRRLRQLFPPLPASLVNSSGIFLGPEYHFDMVRPGVALYGGNPLLGRSNPMLQVVHLQGRILQVHRVDTPRTVGYGATHRTGGSARIATVGVGYADGYPRSLGNRGYAYIGATRVPVIGRVSMDLITLDVSAVAPAEAVPGALVDLIGKGVDIDDLAGIAGTNAYELLTRLGRRYRRVYASAMPGAGGAKPGALGAAPAA